MKNVSALSELTKKINEYRKKYYTNKLLKGVVIGSALILSAFLFITVLEYFGRFSTPVRSFLFFSFLALFAATLFVYIINPLFFLFNLKKTLSNEDIAKQIGLFFPEIKDKLLNILQLSSLNDSDNSLIEASIQQKSKDLRFIRFADAVRFDDNKKYLKYALPPLFIILLISAISPSFFTKSTERIVYFQNEFEDEAPFKFKILNKELIAIKNQDYVLNLQLIGEAIPDNVFIVCNNRKFKMEVLPNTKSYSFVFNKISSNTDFSFIAGGFNSNEFSLEVVTPPSLLSFDVSLTFPSYLKKESEVLNNVGNIVVPEGTIVKWDFTTTETDILSIFFESEKKRVKLSESILGGFAYSKKVSQSTNYQIQLENKSIKGVDDISFYLNVVPDKYPTISLTQIKDSINYNYILLGGNITDDYGLNALKLFYKKSGFTNYQSVDIPLNKHQTAQSYFYQFNVTPLRLEKGDKIDYYLQVWDNDEVNGSKSSKTIVYSFSMPSDTQFEKELAKEAENTEKQFEDLFKKSLEMKRKLDELDKRLKSKKDITFQDKKELENLLKKKEELQNEIQQLQQQLNNLQEKQNRFNELSPQTQEKMQQLQKLMNELLNSENKELYKQLQDLLNKNEDENIQPKLEELKKNERNIDRNIDRTMKLFKNLQLQIKVDDVVKELDKLAEKQEKLAEQTEKVNNPEQMNNLEKEQEKLKEQFQDQKEKLKDINELSKELKKDIDTDKNEQNKVEQEQQNAQKQLENKDSQSSSKSQKKASRSMRNLAQSLSDQMKSEEMEQMDLDMDALRDILENLVKLSFDQEKVLKDIKSLPNGDPRYIELSQLQLKIVDDAKIIEDSLFSLSKRVLQLESFVTKEVTDMKNYMDESMVLLKERKLNVASSKQQFAMTSMNNLALMLSDTFKQMQQMMMNMSMPGSGKGKKGKMPMPGLGKMQQEINKRTENLGSSGMGGRQLSEELAKLAQEQAKLRNQLQQMQEQLNGTEVGKKVGNDIQELQKQMDQNENDLVNKRINPNLINRQKQMLTRLLEVEKAIKEQELDPTRKANTGVSFTRQSPPSLEAFQKLKEKQTELIRTTPLNYTPFYKSQTSEYFKKIK